MQKGGFCVAKTTLLPRKNRVFGLQLIKENEERSNLK